MPFSILGQRFTLLPDLNKGVCTFHGPILVRDCLFFSEDVIEHERSEFIVRDEMLVLTK